jgi:hypothetical protein
VVPNDSIGDAELDFGTAAGQVSRADLPPYQQTVHVAKSGGDYTTIQGAIDSITDATTSKRYAVVVHPGDYAEAVTMKNYVDIIGTGRTNSRITGTSGTVLTYPATKATVSDMGIYVDYGTIGAESSAVVSGGADSIMLRCDITVTKSAGDYQMHSFSITGGAFRMIDSYHTYSITGATTGTQLTQAAVEQNGALTAFLLYNSEITMTSNDTNDDLVAFETTTGGAGTYRLKENIISITATGANATATGLWLYGTATGATISESILTISGTASAWGLYIDSTGGGATVNTLHNNITVTSSGSAVSCDVDTGDTWNSSFDKITAASGYQEDGTINMASSLSSGDTTVSGTIYTGVGLDGVGAIDLDYGSVDITDHTFTTDGTGDAEFVIPNDSIGPAELDSTTGAYDFGSVASLEIPNGNDPDVDAAGEISADDDDYTLRGFDGTNQFAYGMKVQNVCQKTIQKPLYLEDGTYTPIWTNQSGMTFVITEIWAKSDTDNTDFTLTQDGWTDYDSPASIQAVSITNNGGSGNMYYVSYTGLSVSVADGNDVLFNNDATDDPGWVFVSVWGYYDADVN